MDATETEKPLEDSERVTMDSLPNMAWRCRPDGFVEFFNRRWLEYTGLSPDAARGQRWTAVIQPDDLDDVTDRWRRLIASGQPGEIETQLRSGTGEYRRFLIRMGPFRDDHGDIIRWYGIATDVNGPQLTNSLPSTQKMLDEVRVPESRLRRVIDTIPAFVSSFFPGGSIEFMNQRWHDYTGLSSEQAQGDGWQEPVHPDDREPLMNRWREALASGEPGEIEARLRRHDGVFRWFLVRAEPLRDETGKIQRWYATSTDIEDRKQTEEKLRQDERELRRVIDTVPSLAWSTSPDGSGEFWNKRWYDYTGLTPEECVGSGWHRGVHPEDVTPLMNKWAEVLASGQAGEGEARFQRHDGVFRWFLIRAEPLRDEIGKIVRWYGISTDIEDRKQAEEKLRQDECELRLIMDATPEMIVVHDPDGSPIYANKAVLDYTGMTLDDVPHPDFRWGTIHPEDLERFKDERQAALLRGVPFEIELRGRRKDGQYRWFLNRYNPFRDEQGRLARWYSTGTDIEDRKRAEDLTRNENVALREEIDRASMFEEIVGGSPALHAVISRVTKVAPTDSTVLITGETGTGKELIARAIHKRSARAARAFVAVNCAGIPQSLISSELFGHEKGAFTGALQRRLGRFELAEGGTLFLDEIGDLPSETQISLLRVLQEREFERVGGNQVIRADVRVIAATNRDLQAAIAAGTFRSDLYYRLNVFPIETPPLRDRQEDIPILIEYFIGRYAAKAGKAINSIESKTLGLLKSYPWPGNIRELQNVIERSMILCENETFSIDEHWLPSKSQTHQVTRPDLNEKISSDEKTLIETALSETRGRVSGPSGAAVKLGIPPSTLDSKIKALNIDKHRFRRT